MLPEQVRCAPNDATLPSATDDPGVPGTDLQDMDTSLFVPAAVNAAPAGTVAYPLTISLQNADDGRFLGFMNSTVRLSSLCSFFVCGADEG